MNQIIRTKIEQSKQTRLLHLSGLSLYRTPILVWNLTDIKRLDLSFNRLTNISSSIGELTQLESLWLNNNPLLCLPSEIQSCRKLKVLDLRETLIKKPPRELARIPSLLELDVGGTPLEEKMIRKGHSPNDIFAYLSGKDIRKNLKINLYEKLCKGLYLEISRKGEEGNELINRLVKTICKGYQDLNELKQIVRHCDYLFPNDFDSTWDFRQVIEFVKRRFDRLNVDNEKKRLSAEMEIRICGIYYGIIEPPQVEQIIYEIYQEIENIDLLRFLIENSKHIFPETLENISGELISTNLSNLLNEWETSYNNIKIQLQDALYRLYPSLDTENIIPIINNILSLFRKNKPFPSKKEIEDLKRLTADVDRFFPTEWTDIEPTEIYQLFRQYQNSLP